MKELVIRLTGLQKIGEAEVYIDGAPARFEAASNGAVCKYQTEKDSVNIRVYRALNVGGVFWFITQLVFFLITLFGLFDIHARERGLVIDFEARVDLGVQANELTLKFNYPKENAQAITVQTGLDCRVTADEFRKDDKAVKILKGLKWAKSACAIATVATAIAVLTLTL